MMQGKSPKTDKRPRRLYKYRAFSNLTLEMLVEDRLFFADPSTFNDPLDSRPSLNTDLAVPELERIYVEFVQQRISAEMSAAAKSIKYRGPRTVEHIARQAQRHAVERVADIRYNSTNPDYEVKDPLQFLLGQYVEEELLRRYDKGIVSFAERATCPLMWSHYGDQHKGLCIGYSIPADVTASVRKVEYDGGRLVHASSVAAMIEGDENARREVDAAVLFRKAPNWRYEREWRLTGPRGLQDSSLELEEVIFGIRCSPAVKYAAVKALEERHRRVSFFEMRELHGTFRLKKFALDTDELSAFLPRRSRSIHEAFESVTLPSGDDIGSTE